MWYDGGYENSSLHPPFERRRTPPGPGWITLERCLRLTPLPDLARLRPRRTGDSYRKPVGLPQADRSQCDPWLHYSWTGGVARRLFATPSAANHVQRRGRGGAARPVTSQSPRLWPPDQLVDFAAGRPGQFPTGTDPYPGLGRERAPGSPAVGYELETRQTLDHQPRSAVPAKKNARD